MGPLCRRRAKTTRKSSRKKTLSKIQKSKNQEAPILPANSPVKPSVDCSSKDMEDAEMCGCSTPKAERFRIPEITTCPPAPKKRRVITPCSLRRTSIAFFTPPDIDLFFNLALRGGIPV